LQLCESASTELAVCSSAGLLLQIMLSLLDVLAWWYLLCAICCCFKFT